MGLNRRTFIQFAVGGGVGILFTPAIWKVLDDVSIWTQNWPWISKLKYGETEAVPALCKLTPSGSAVRVMTVKGGAYETEGDPENPLSMGGVDPVSASAVQLMYSPVRVKSPMKKTGEGTYEPISWDDAAKVVADKVKAARGNVAVISGDESGTANEVLSAFLTAVGSSSYYMMPSPALRATKAWNDVMGGEGQIGYDIENSDYVLAIGADILDSFGTTVRNQAAFAANKGDAKYVYAGPCQNRTSAVSDKWVPVSPEGMTAFALGVAYYLIKNGASIPSADFDALRSLLASKYSPEKAAQASGVDKAVMEEVAKELASAGKPLVIADWGGGAAATTAGIILNLLLSGLNAPGGMTAVADSATVVDGALPRVGRVKKDLVADLAGGKFAPKVLMVYEANPAYAMPQLAKTGEALAKAEFTISFATYLDETAAVADLVLPAPHCFERFDDIANPFGVADTYYLGAAPIAKAVLDVKSTPDFLLELAGNMGLTLGFDSFEEVLDAKSSVVSEASGTVDAFGFGLGVSVLSGAAKKGSGKYAVAPYSQLNVGTDLIATPPHNAVTISNTELIGKEMYVDMCGVTAKELGVVEGEKIKLSSADADIQALVHINEGVMPGVVAAPLGFGHTAWDEFSKGKGDNVYKILTVNAESGTGLSAWTGSTVNIAKI